MTGRPDLVGAEDGQEAADQSQDGQAGGRRDPDGTDGPEDHATDEHGLDGQHRTDRTAALEGGVAADGRTLGDGVPGEGGGADRSDGRPRGVRGR